jgi:hypothetical protein
VPRCFPAEQSCFEISVDAAEAANRTAGRRFSLIGNDFPEHLFYFSLTMSASRLELILADLNTTLRQTT